MKSQSKLQVIRPSGIFDGRKGRKLYQDVMELLESDTTTILVDLAEVNFMDSSGFGTLLLTLKVVRQKQARLVLCSINDQIKMILELSDTSKVFEVFPDQKSFTQAVS